MKQAAVSAFNDLRGPQSSGYHIYHNVDVDAAAEDIDFFPSGEVGTAEQACMVSIQVRGSGYISLLLKGATGSPAVTASTGLKISEADGIVSFWCVKGQNGVADVIASIANQEVYWWRSSEKALTFSGSS